jgi:hypothetical protein
LQHQFRRLSGRLNQHFFGFLLGKDAFGEMGGNALL